ncbi:MAG: UPF0149 family protein [Gammaproteobacteria bacterium]|nr:UPF0149 family protein [Gammaproteobacteria bacterium]
MNQNDAQISLPAYGELSSLVEPIDLPFSLSQLHGLLCGYICIGQPEQALTFLNTLLSSSPASIHAADKAALLSVFSISEHLITHLDFSFQLLLPDDGVALPERAKAFSEWCQGFLQGFHLPSSSKAQLNEDTQDLLFHLQEFSLLDYEQLAFTDDDELALTEVYEYTRLAVLHLKADKAEQLEDPRGKQAH